MLYNEIKKKNEMRGPKAERQTSINQFPPADRFY